ncbi:MAG: hypothetical protein QNI84_01360 [Henriciella sp.]|nr:hypothetical protein [Henriciella sp.]
MVGQVWRIMGTIVALALASVIAPVQIASAGLGDEVTNIAHVTYETPDGEVQIRTNPAIFRIEARSTPSEIEFFRVAPAAPDAVPVVLNGTDYSPGGGLAGPFLPVDVANGLGQPPPDIGDTLMLVPTDTYLSGEHMVVRVIDEGQNGDPDEIETVVIRMVTDRGDTITLRLYEDGPDRGHFYACFPSTSEQTAQNDILVTAPKNTTLTATYQDAFDDTEVSVDTALVDPFGRVFDSYTGELLNDVRVTIVDAVTGFPATVYGVDGVSAYPSTLLTGSTITDASGRVYALTDGEFLFPLMAPGDYRLEIETPESYAFPSMREADDFADLQNAPFEIIPGSYGSTFTVLSTGPLNLDVPLDPNGDLVLRKDASESRAAIGDFIGYTIQLENSGSVPAPMQLRDTLPEGMRYVEGTARKDGLEIAEPEISADGRTLIFAQQVILAGQSAQISYLVSVGPGTPTGERVNSAVAVNTQGTAISNVAEAAVIIEEDLLSSRVTIVGRVAEAACTPEDDWARPIEDGIGIAGVRLYLETGQYVLTDEDGLYHFEGIEPGTHVVQVDEATLPKGYDPVVCEENTRYAGSALSKFVDAQGGTLWRANFYLERNGEALETTTDAAALERSEDVYDQAWLDAQTDASPRWVYPEIGDTPSGRSIAVGIVHPRDQRVQLSINGAPVSALNYGGRDLSDDRMVGLSRWGGVDIQMGGNTLEAVIIDAEGNEITRLQREVWLVDEVHRASLVDDQSLTVADGRTKPVIAVRLEDAAGHPVHQGRIVEVQVAAPYRLAQAAEREFEQPVATAFSAVSGSRVGAGGIALVELEPTLQAGRVQLQVKLHDGSLEEVDVWLKPEKRDWVLVGLAEAEGFLSNSNRSGERDERELMSDGRLAFFAKGVVRGDWLLTVAVDTAKRRGASDETLFDDIDPNAYYTLYGDRTVQFDDAAGQYPVYVKLERDTFQALFGDFETALTATELGRYSRRLSGLKADYESDRYSVTAFASETNQGFQKDELAADGTSGPFTLRTAPIVRNSETIVVETRDRFRPDQIVGERILNRYSDYEIDYETGELFFRLPVEATDAGFNPNVILVDYETTNIADRKITAGGRAAVRFADGAAETGVTIISQNDGSLSADGPSELIAADATLQVTDNLQLRGEIASSSSETTDGEADGSAFLVEAVRRGRFVSATGYYREESEGFGIGQQSSSTSALRRVGAQISAELGVSDSAEGAGRSVRRLDGQVYREENLSDNSRRDVADLTLRHESPVFNASVGFRAISEDFEDEAEPRQSLLLTSSVQKVFVDQGITLTAAHEEPLYGGGDNDDEATLFPGRTLLGIDKTLGRTATLNIRHEATNGTNASGENTIAGITWTPRANTHVFASSDLVTQDSAQRLGATVGVDQTWYINEQWSLSSGLSRRANVDGDDEPLDVTDDAAIGVLEDGLRSTLVEDETYTSAHLGAGYRGDQMATSGRLEWRDSQSGDRFVASFGGAREISKELSFSAAARLQDETLVDADDRESLDIRIAGAWRPRGDGVIVLNRFDVGHDKIDNQSLRTKAVNNLTLNKMLSDRAQASFYNGIKYVEQDFEGASASGFTVLVGTELRHDVTERIDLGLHAFWTSGEASQTSEWSIGPSIGFSPQDNVWVSLGWNMYGFEDEDFEAASYAQDGPFLKIRAKFDQNTLKGLFSNLGLASPEDTKTSF